MTALPRRTLHAALVLAPLVCLVVGDRANSRSLMFATRTHAAVAGGVLANRPLSDRLRPSTDIVETPAGEHPRAAAAIAAALGVAVVGDDGHEQRGIVGGHSAGNSEIDVVGGHGVDASSGSVPDAGREESASSSDAEEGEPEDSKRKVSFGDANEVREIMSVSEARLIHAVGDSIFDCGGDVVIFDFSMNEGWATVYSSGITHIRYTVEYVAHGGFEPIEDQGKRRKVERRRFQGTTGFELRDPGGVAQHVFFLDNDTFFLLSHGGSDGVGELKLQECTHDVHAEATALLGVLTGREYVCTRNGMSGNRLETVTFSTDRHISIVKHHGETVRYTYEKAAKNYDPQHHGFRLGNRRFDSPDQRRPEYGKLAFLVPDDKGRPVLLEASCSARTN